MSATLLLDPSELDSTVVTVSGDSFRHLFRVRRLQVGDRLRLIDGRGRAVWSIVTAVGRQRAELELGEAAPSNLPTVELTLAVAAPRPERASWLVEKGTELGATAFDFFNCERAPRTYGASTLERLRRVARAAVEQSQRSRLPEVRGMRRFDDILASLRGAHSSYLLDRTGDPVAPPLAAGPTIAVIGPEGVLCAAEVASLRESGARLMSLGPATLRLETAGIAAAVVLLAG